MSSTNLWRNYILQKQTELCPSEGKAQRKVTAKCTRKCKDYQKMRKLLLALDKEMKGIEYVLDRENQRRKRQDPVIKSVWAWFFNRKGSICDALKIYQPTIGVYDCSCSQNALNLTWTRRRVLVHEICQHAKAVNKQSNGGNDSSQRVAGENTNAKQ